MLGGIALAFAPCVAALTLISVRGAVVAALGIMAAAAGATQIQFFFRKQATRRYFRHRQTASRFATFAEAFSSICMGRRGRTCGRQHVVLARAGGDRDRGAVRGARDEPA